MIDKFLALKKREKQFNFTKRGQIWEIKLLKNFFPYGIPVAVVTTEM